MPPVLHRQAEAGGHRWAYRPLRASLRQARQEGLIATSALDPQQRARLAGAKLRALVSSTGADSSGALPETFPGGAALVCSGAGWFLADGDAATALGPALAWARRVGVASVDVVADTGYGDLARRSTLFSAPSRIWRVVGAALEPASPVETPPQLEPPIQALDLVALLDEAGLEIVIERGVVTGEILGLEVARIVVDDVGAARVEVGVGRHDREAFAMLHGDLPTDAALAKVVDSVRRHRRSGADLHPLGLLSRQRWLRSALVADPGAVGMATLEAVEPVLERDGVKDASAAVAVGVDVEGGRCVVACSAGIDLDFVPAAADARARYAPDARLVLAVPERDAHPVTRYLARALRDPVELVIVDVPW